MGNHTGQQRPEFADTPDAGQESVWDYPRPPALVDCSQTVEVVTGEQRIALTRRSKRVLETASPPTVYIPPDDIHMDLLIEVAGQSYCEWKGAAAYWALADSDGRPGRTPGSASRACRRSSGRTGSSGDRGRGSRADSQSPAPRATRPGTSGRPTSRSPGIPDVSRSP